LLGSVLKQAIEKPIRKSLEELKIGNTVIRITKADEKRIVEVEVEQRPDSDEETNP